MFQPCVIASHVLAMFCSIAVPFVSPALQPGAFLIFHGCRSSGCRTELAFTDGQWSFDPEWLAATWSSVTSLAGGAGWCGCVCLGPALGFQPSMTARATGKCALLGTHRGSGREVHVLATVERPALLFTASLGRPAFSRTTLAHATLAHATLLHATFSHTTRSHPYTAISQLSHTHTHNSCTHNCFILIHHTVLTHIHTTLSHATFSHTTRSHTYNYFKTSSHTQLLHTHTTVSPSYITPF